MAIAEFHGIAMKGPFSLPVEPSLPLEADVEEVAQTVYVSGHLFYWVAGGGGGVAGGHWQSLEDAAIGTVGAILTDASTYFADPSNPTTVPVYWNADPLNLGHTIRSSYVKGLQFESTITTGTAPLVVVSETMVSHLNVEFLGGLRANKFYRLDQGNSTEIFTGPKITFNMSDTDYASVPNPFLVAKHGATTIWTISSGGRFILEGGTSWCGRAGGATDNFYIEASAETGTVMIQKLSLGATAIGGDAAITDVLWTVGGLNPRVGVGTPAPTTVFHVAGPGTTARDAVRIESALDGTPTGDLVFIQARPDAASGAGYGLLKIGIGAGYATPVLRVMGDGKVGIGTFAPTKLFHVSGVGLASDITADLLVQGTGTYGAGVTLKATGSGGREYALLSSANSAGSGGGRFAIYDKTAGGTAYRFTIDSGGIVGIGLALASPGATLLDVNGQVKIRGGTPGGNKILRSDLVGLATWVTAGSLGIPTGVGIDKRVMYWDGTAGGFGQSSDFTFDYTVTPATLKLNGKLYVNFSSETNAALQVNSGSLDAANLTASASGKSALVAVGQSSANGITASSAGGTYVGSFEHSGTTGDQLRLIRRNGTGDASIVLWTGTSPSARWTMGVHQAASNTFKLSASSALGTSDAFELTSVGILNLPQAFSRVRIGAVAADTVLNPSSAALLAKIPNGTGGIHMRMGGSNDADIVRIRDSTAGAGEIFNIGWRFSSFYAGVTGAPMVGIGMRPLSVAFNSATLTVTNRVPLAVDDDLITDPQTGIKVAAFFIGVDSKIGIGAFEGASNGVCFQATTTSPGQYAFLGNGKVVVTGSFSGVGFYAENGGSFVSGAVTPSAHLYNSGFEALHPTFHTGAEASPNNFRTRAVILRLSGLTHGITNKAPTDAYAAIGPANATGGAVYVGFSDTNADVPSRNGVVLQGVLSEDPGSNTSAIQDSAPVALEALKASGISIQAITVGDYNLATIRNSGNAVFAFQSNGEAWALTGGTGSTYYALDDYDDVELVNAVQATLAPETDPIRERFADLVREKHDILVKERIIGYGTKGQLFQNTTRIGQLSMGAIRQLGREFRSMAAELALANARIATLEANR